MKERVLLLEKKGNVWKFLPSDCGWRKWCQSFSWAGLSLTHSQIIHRNHVSAALYYFQLSTLVNEKSRINVKQILDEVYVAANITTDIMSITNVLEASVTPLCHVSQSTLAFLWLSNNHFLSTDRFIHKPEWGEHYTVAPAAPTYWYPL